MPKQSVKQPAAKRQPVKSPVTRNAAYAATPKAKRGFALMSKRKRSEIASMGGTTVSSDPRHMAKLGRRGAASRFGSKA
jgi:hypothetical protein